MSFAMSVSSGSDPLCCFLSSNVCACSVVAFVSAVVVLVAVGVVDVFRTSHCLLWVGFPVSGMEQPNYVRRDCVSLS